MTQSGILEMGGAGELGIDDMGLNSEGKGRLRNRRR
jgi:hypothetical protein